MNDVRSGDNYSDAGVVWKYKPLIYFEEAYVTELVGFIWNRVGVEFKVVEVPEFVRSVSLVADCFYGNLRFTYFVYLVEKAN